MNMFHNTYAKCHQDQMGLRTLLVVFLQNKLQPGLKKSFFLNKKIRFFKNLNRIFIYLFDIFIYFIFFKSGIHNVIKYFTIRLSGVNTTTQVCTLCAFVLKNKKNFVGLDACKQLFVLNSYKSAIKKTGSQKKKT